MFALKFPWTLSLGLGTLSSVLCILIESVVSWVTCTFHLLRMSFWLCKKKQKRVSCFPESPNATLSILWGLVLDYISEIRRTAWRGIILEHNGVRRGNKGGECFPYFSQEDPILSGIFVCQVGDAVDHISSSWIFTYKSQYNPHIYHAVMILVIIMR